MLPLFSQRFRSIGLYGEQGLEAWHGRYGQSAKKHPGGTELERARAFMQAMALAREAGSEVLARHSPSRRPSAAGVHKAKKVGDKRRRENKAQLPTCGAEASKAIKARMKWAAGVCKEAATTIRAYQLREKSYEQSMSVEKRVITSGFRRYRDDSATAGAPAATAGAALALFGDLRFHKSGRESGNCPLPHTGPPSPRPSATGTPLPPALPAQAHHRHHPRRWTPLHELS